MKTLMRFRSPVKDPQRNYAVIRDETKELAKLNKSTMDRIYEGARGTVLESLKNYEKGLAEMHLPSGYNHKDLTARIR